jgi:predicted hotdog family 3-hydroxylacyl-ACP dehydratase
MSDLKGVCALGIEALLPHRPPMVLIDRALGLDGEWFVAEVDIRPECALYDGAGVPAYAGIEYMAQAVAAYAGAEGRELGGAVHVGMLLGTREYLCAEPAFPLGQRLQVRVRKVLHQPGGISAMDCRILDKADGRELAQAQLTVVQVEDLSLLGARP